MARTPQQKDFIESCIMCKYLYRSAKEQKFYCSKLKYIHQVTGFPFRDHACSLFKYLFDRKRKDR